MQLSVIIPLYNAENYIKEALDSLLAQKGIDIEIIVVDDESQDNSAEIVKKYPVQYYKKTNGGASSARNYGLKHASGKHIMFLDADDYLKDEYICKNCIEKCEKDNLDFVMFTYQYYNTRANKYGASVNYPKILEEDTDAIILTEKMVSCGIFPASPCFKIIKRSFLLDNKLMFDEGTTSEDIEWFTRLLIYAKKFKVVNNDAYIYRKGISTSVTGSFTEWKCWNFINVMHKTCNLVLKSKSPRMQKALYSALCYEYYILLGNSKGFIHDKTVLKELKSLWFLHNYTEFPRTKYLSILGSLFGIRNLSRILSYIIEHHSKSHK